jgi:hypothetical protein
MHPIALAMMDIIIILHLSKPVKLVTIQYVEPAKLMLQHVSKLVIVTVIPAIPQVNVYHVLGGNISVRDNVYLATINVEPV